MIEKDCMKIMLNVKLAQKDMATNGPKLRDSFRKIIRINYMNQSLYKI